MSRFRPRVMVVEPSDERLAGWLTRAGCAALPWSPRTGGVEGLETMGRYLSISEWADLVLVTVPPTLTDPDRVLDWLAMAGLLEVNQRRPTILVALSRWRELIDQIWEMPWVAGLAVAVYGTHRPAGWAACGPAERDDSIDRVAGAWFAAGDQTDAAAGLAETAHEAAIELIAGFEYAAGRIPELEPFYTSP